MEANEKLMLMMDMLENPGKYTDRQFEEMLCDEECRSDYEMLAAMRSIYGRRGKGLTQKNIDEEWRRFEETHFKPVTSHKGNTNSHTNIRKFVAAASIAIAVSCISFAAIRFMTERKERSRETQKTETSAIVQSQDTSVSAVSVQLKSIPKESTRTYDNIELDSILSDIASAYGMEVSYRSDKVRHLRLFFQWDTQDKPEQVIGSLNNFERVNISIEGTEITVE